MTLEGTMPSLSVLMLVLTMITITVIQIPPVQGRIKLENGAYKDIVVTINPDASFPKDKAEQLLNRFKTLFTEASKMLFHASKRHVYFKEITVVVPEEWPTQGYYENALNVQLDKPDILVEAGNPALGDNPYVTSYAECGAEGLNMHLTPNYILFDDVSQQWGNRAKTIVHEWAHLRWGVFDEYPVDKNDKSFYRHGGLWEPTRCTREVEGRFIDKLKRTSCKVASSSSEPGDNCVFVPMATHNKAIASLMYYHSIESVVEFCDDPQTSPTSVRHNKFAPNRQNRLCYNKSVWEIMRFHGDFWTNPNLPTSTDTNPTFRFVQARPRKRVLVLDTSGSMGGTPIQIQKQAMSNFILSNVDNGSQLGIVRFSYTASVLSPLVKIDSEADRKRLVNLLPTKAYGGTSIGSGLLKGIEVLEAEGPSPGASIILVTDGEENEDPRISEVIPKLVQKGIIVHTFAFGRQADSLLSSLALKTGGKKIFYNAKANSTALLDGLAATVAAESAAFPSDVYQTILTTVGQISAGSPFTGSFFLDSTVGRDTSLLFSYKGKIKIFLDGPGGTYNEEPDEGCGTTVTCENIYQVSKMVLPNLTMPGLWNYTVTTESSNPSSITLNVMSKSRKKGEAVLKVSSWISATSEEKFNPKMKIGVFADVLRGSAPVLDATVIASVERPGSDIPLDIELFDNGAGADIIQNDGVYSAYVLATDLLGSGRYNAKIKVNGKEGQVKVITGGKGTASGAPPLYESLLAQTPDTRTENIGNFQRVTTTGEFEVTDVPTGPIPDEIPPARITDFRVLSFDYSKLTASLAWTAVGDEMDRGAASRYILYLVNHMEELYSNPADASKFSGADVVKGDLYQTKPSGSPEALDIRVQPLGKKATLYLGVVAVDDAGNTGAMSNIAFLSIAEEFAVPGVTVENKSENLSVGLILLVIGLLFSACF